GSHTKAVTVNCAADTVTSIDVPFILSQPKLWTPDHPYLYSMELSLFDNGMSYDTERLHFGIRSITTDGNRILLNGKPITLKGFNRYDIFSRRGPILNEREVRKDLQKIKDTGANTIRVHYPQSPLTLRLLDEIGLMLIEEIPLNWWGQNWWTKEKVAQDTSILKQARITIERMIKRDRNHPCIIAWSLANECKTETDVGDYVIRELIKKARSIDDSRLITFSTNGEANQHPAFNEADIVCCNVYYGNDTAHHLNLLDSLVRKPSEEHIRRQCGYYPDKPMIVSEFGSGGIKKIRGDNSFSEEHQSEYIKQVWQAIKNVPGCSGGIVWSWADYYHRKNFINYNSYGPYGVVNINREPKESFKTISKMFQDN
ncbi:MAG TPA: hypothetical protein EYP36_10055, partial [Calditrichaeota bacterium]|nr:hypothetical protein [Calditrichota bacterium]